VNRLTNIWNSPRNQSWAEELVEYGRILASTTLAYGFFRLMKVIGMKAEYVDTLEQMDQIATVVIFGAFLLSIIRRALVQIF
jgi:hypothetical protein